VTEYTYVAESTGLPDRVVVHVTAKEVQDLVKKLWGGQCEDSQQIEIIARQECLDRFDRWWKAEGLRLRAALARRYRDKVIR
jgi:hypothetical protein